RVTAEPGPGPPSPLSRTSPRGRSVGSRLPRRHRRPGSRLTGDVFHEEVYRGPDVAVLLVLDRDQGNTVVVIRGGNATIYVSDMQRAVDFYHGTLELPLVFRADDHWAELD